MVGVFSIKTFLILVVIFFATKVALAADGVPPGYGSQLCKVSVLKGKNLRSCLKHVKRAKNEGPYVMAKVVCYDYNDAKELVFNEKMVTCYSKAATLLQKQDPEIKVAGDACKTEQGAEKKARCLDKLFSLKSKEEMTADLASIIGKPVAIAGDDPADSDEDEDDGIASDSKKSDDETAVDPPFAI